jgi:dihydroxyacetone kinase-like protein
MGIGIDKVRSMIFEIAKVMEERKQYLSDLDQAIGDGDHGFNMARGFGVAVKELESAPCLDISDVLRTLAMALISNIGGASGPLYGTLFLKASTAAKGLKEIDLEDFTEIFKSGILGVQTLGKAELGDKTMLDVLIPTLKSLEDANAGNLSGREAFANAEKVAGDCMEKTKDFIAKKGRASYLGERSIGYIDLGAASSYLMIRTVSKALI